MAIDYFDTENEEAPPATLERLTELAARAKALETEINTATVELQKKQDDLDKILRGYIPDIFKELALEEYKLATGEKITVKDDVKCNISEERKPAAFGWLREHNYDGIIKTAVNATFGKGEAQRAADACAVLIEAGYDASVTDSVHPQTLKAFVKEQLEAGTAIPIDTFGIFEFRIAKITAPKARK
jgi:hypothetical protein